MKKKTEQMINQRVWTKQDELNLINQLQDEYVDKLSDLIDSLNPSDVAMKYLNFTATTGTGKTKMMAKLINKYPDAFFIITTLSKGQLNQQIANSLYKDCTQDNFIVFGAMSLKVNTILTEDDVLRMLPENKDIYWLRDEGHINTNNWEKVLVNKCKKIINVSATNKMAYGIDCDFTETMMLRTVHQSFGQIQDSLNMLKDIKKKHKAIKHYNPCAIFRVNSSRLEQEIIDACKKHKYKVISLINNTDYSMEELCKDDNKYDVIINQQKIVEGIDIRRAHVIWMESKPQNAATTIQQIGRCRRNALLWRNDIDILNPINKELLEHTRQCFVFYNTRKLEEMDNADELYLDLCPIISIEKLHAGYTIYVDNGVMSNGLFVAELENKTGFFTISKDEETGFNVVNNDEVYQTEIAQREYCYSSQTTSHKLECLIDNLTNKNSKYFRRLTTYFAEHYKWHNRESARYVVEFNKNNNEYEHVFTCYDLFQICTGLWSYNRGYKLTKNVLQKIQHHFDIFENKDYNDSGIIISRQGFEFYKKALCKHQSTDQTIIKSEDLKCIYLWGYPFYIDDITTLLYNVQNDVLTDKEDIRLQILQLLGIEEIKPYFYKETTSNKLITILGVDNFTQYKTSERVEWQPERNVTAKVSYNTKFNQYIEKTYFNQIKQAQRQVFTGHNSFSFNARYNSCLGHCVEYFAKYLLYGSFFLNIHGDKDILTVIHACLLKYREDIKQRFGTNISKKIQVPTVDTLRKPEAQDFVNAIIELGNKTADFVREHMDVEESKNTSPFFCTEHIVGIADFVSKDTIIDLKCTNHIDLQMVRQVLGYHFLSQFRSDLDIKNVIVYDAVSGRFVEIELPENNM